MEKWPNQYKEEISDSNLKDFATESVKYLSGKLSNNQRILLKRIEEEISSGITVLPDIKKEDNIYSISHKILTSYLENKNLEIKISDTKKEEPFTKDGELLMENEYAKIQINDKQKYIEKNERLKSLVKLIEEEAENFITPQKDSFKSIVVVDENLLSIRMDPGHHKEFLGVLLLEGEKNPGAIIYKHTPSNYERTNKNSRADYIQKITSGKINEKRGVYASSFITDPEEFKEKFREYLRLCQSVKNLDLKLNKEDVSFAVNMFKKGVINMEGFLLCCDEYNSFEEYLQFGRNKKLINQSEEKILEEYFNENKQRKEYIKERLKLLQSAKDLNFEAIADLIDLDNEAKNILSISEPSPKRAERFIESYKKIADKIIQMEKFAKLAIGYRSSLLEETNVKELTDHLYKNIEQLAFVAKFGYGSQDVLKHSDNSIDVGEEGRKRLPEMAKNAYEQFAKILQDKGEKISKWTDVESLEEAIRFLHDLIIKIPVIFATYYGDADQLVKSKFFRKEKTKENLDPLEIINVTTSNTLENSELAKTVIDNFKSLGDRFKDVFERNREQSPIAVFADDHFELSLPTAKHYIEMSSQIYEKKQKEYTIALRYVESGYQGSLQRQDFAAAIFEQLGFKVKRDRSERGSLYANFKCDEKETWNKAFQDTIRLSMALKDLDLREIKSDMIELFKEGVISRFREFRNIKKIIESNGEINKDIGDNDVRLIMELGSNSEKYLLLNLLSANMKSFKKDFEPFLGDLSENQLDNIATLLFDLEDEAKKKGDKKLINRLHRIGDKVVELILKEEKQKKGK